MPKVFISHSTKDQRAVKEIVNLLEKIGVRGRSSIFCSSYEPYNTLNYGENFIMQLKRELEDDCIVIFYLSKNFYNSHVCLCEMGAAWVQAKTIFPMLEEGLDFSEMRGVLSGETHAFFESNGSGLDKLRDKLITLFGITDADTAHWNIAKEDFISNVRSLKEVKGEHEIQSSSSELNSRFFRQYLGKGTSSWLENVLRDLNSVRTATFMWKGGYYPLRNPYSPKKGEEFVIGYNDDYSEDYLIGTIEFAGYKPFKDIVNADRSTSSDRVNCGFKDYNLLSSFVDGKEKIGCVVLNNLKRISKTEYERLYGNFKESRETGSKYLLIRST
ncbi:hypothetical protein PAT3040_01908 [Paenibacillus agaridevorans]|uniref:TIR domain-containing protein n=1 Tax=Paenibacillus agaridevorans TaxID=171404 RepID=A0A2R5EL40_9BACL|nr:toll/interleukin-1 receptor domain-containing protein [Paenibacillus agaridevorans]GBG07360.1 hypothetical protein PAT3040_01908 [Paenibacillus agaridevorans]